MNTEITASRGAVEVKKEKLVNDIKTVVDDADKLLKEVANSAAEEFAGARTKFEAQMGEAKSRLHDARVTAANNACSAMNATQDYARQNPLKIIAVAAAGLIAVICLSRCSSK